MSTLRDSLISWWSMDETSGTRVDSHGSNDLSDGNTVTSRAGKQGNAASFSDASQEYLKVIDNAEISVGDNDYTWAGWMLLDDKGSAAIFTKWGSSGGEFDYGLDFTSGDDRFRFYTRNTADTSQTTVYADQLGSPSIATWYFFLCWHDSVNNEIGIQIDNGAADTAPHTGGVHDGSDPLYFGGSVGDGGNRAHLDGAIDEAGIWSRLLISSEKSELHNSGSGISYSDTAPPAGGNQTIIAFSERFRQGWERIFGGGIDKRDQLWKPEPQILTPTNAQVKALVA